MKYWISWEMLFWEEIFDFDRVQLQVWEKIYVYEKYLFDEKCDFVEIKCEFKENKWGIRMIV